MTDETKNYILGEFEKGLGSVEHYQEIKTILKAQGTDVTVDEIKDVHVEFLDTKYPNRLADALAAKEAIEAKLNK